jgi:hypothetical protein
MLFEVVEDVQKNVATSECLRWSLICGILEQVCGGHIAGLRKSVS